MGTIRSKGRLACVVWLASAACLPSPAATPDPGNERMLAHFDLAIEMRGQAVRGDVEGFRETAAELSRLRFTSDLPPDPLDPLAPMRALAGAGVDAETPGHVAAVAARVAGTCGDCHVAHGAGLGDRFVVGGPPPGGGLARHMAGLGWVSRLLWDGVVGPSPRTWAAGAEALQVVDTLLHEPEPRIPDPDLVASWERLRSLGREAAGAHDMEEQVRILADVWMVCASCHRRGDRVSLRARPIRRR